MKMCFYWSMCNLHKIFVFLPSTRGLIVTEYTHFQKISGEEAMTSISKVSRVILRRPKDDKNNYRYRRCILHVFYMLLCKAWILH